MARENGIADSVKVTEMDTLPMESAGVRASNPQLPSYAQRAYQGLDGQNYTSVIGSWLHIVGAAGGKVSLVKIAPDGTASMFVDWIQA